MPARKRPGFRGRWACPRLALHVGELLRYLAVADGDHVDAPHVAADPVVAPALHHPLARDERVLHGEVATPLPDRAVSFGPPLPPGRPARARPARGGWVR